jgi:hypothetical protein
MEENSERNGTADGFEKEAERDARWDRDCEDGLYGTEVGEVAASPACAWGWSLATLVVDWKILPKTGLK